MAFESVNELEQFIYDDCQITDAGMVGENLVVTLEALIVGSRNSQNGNFTESYADTATLELRKAKILSAVVEGYKQFDADDRLIEEVADKPIPEEEWGSLLPKMKDGFLFQVECLEKTAKGFQYSFEVDMDTVNDYGLQDPYCTTYEIVVSFEGSRVSWDRYLNRVQK